MRGFAPIFLILLIVIVATVSAAGYYFLRSSKPVSKQIDLHQTVQSIPPSSPTAESTSSADITTWKTYTNTKDNYTIQYPSDYRHEFMEIDKNATLQSISPFDFEDWSSGAWIGSGGTYGDNIQLSIYADTGDQLSTAGPNDETVILAGQKAVKQTVSADSRIILDGKAIEKVGTVDNLMITIGPVKHNGLIYKFQHKLPNKQADRTNFYTMLSTFKFIR